MPANIWVEVASIIDGASLGIIKIADSEVIEYELAIEELLVPGTVVVVDATGSADEVTDVLRLS